MSDLNLARKWRPKTFNQIVGQQTSVRMLLNSLFLNKLFPVYLFTGLRGCGKTSTARVFSAAVNCHDLKNFQLNPDGNKIPCLSCLSCKAFIQSNHPDFIEIDAASHTGVDNVRQIIEASSYMPLLSQKKIYLIDEAHMLSKSAFNALLKILEEPPASVLFILATTEVHKIPETVLSRCFQVTFTPLGGVDLHNHLRSMCTEENISIDDYAIDLIISETEGSVRDAINLLERARFSDSVISQETVLKLLGKISIKELLGLFSCLITQDSRKLLEYLEFMNFESVSVQNLWDMLVELCRALLWIKYGINSVKSGFNQNIQELILLSNKCSLNRLHAIFQLLWTQEELFLRTSKKHIFLEMVLLQICEQTNVLDVAELINMAKGLSDRVVGGENIVIQRPVTITSDRPDVIEKPHQNETQGLCSQSKGAGVAEPELKSPWDSFLQSIKGTEDPILNSIFKQAVFLKFDTSSKKIDLQLNNGGKFFKDKVEETREIWLSKLKESFELVEGINFVAPPDGEAIHTRPCVVNKFSDNNKKDILNSQKLMGSSEIVNVKDKDKWPLANLIIDHFPGTIKKTGVDD